MYDVVIKNGKIVSGSGNPWYKADIGIIGDTISFIGDISKESANKVIFWRVFEGS
ncbi:hypothetical protein [Clostridium fermenticellae]|uniref:hypothetical protein n=1 Tax=Clostridium fermenticellae TaxID=2068654 RepID=UPI0013C42772|nr:hypothetical protein [Clostridium fermenticellae]